MKPRRMFQAAKASMKEGLNVQGLFIFGFPHETWKNMWRTYVTILKCAVLGFTEVNISAFFPMPGTVEFEKLRAQGKITVDDGYFYSLFDYLTLGKHISWNDRLSSAALRRVILFSFFSFFAVSWTLRPWRFVAGVWQLLHGRTENKVFRVLRSLLTGGGFKATKVVAQMPPPPPPPVGEPVLPRHA